MLLEAAMQNQAVKAVGQSSQIIGDCPKSVKKDRADCWNETNTQYCWFAAILP